MYHICCWAKYLIAASIPLLLLGLSACSEVSEFEKRQAWLDRNYPSRSKNLAKLNNPQRFKQEILNGDVVLNMTWDEALVASDVPPYGPKSVNKVVWCDGKVVAQCDSQCRLCQAMLVTDPEVILFETGQRGLQVSESYPNNKWPPHLAYIPSSYEAARAIMRNEYQVGMRFNDIYQVQQPQRSLMHYYCNNLQSNRSDVACSDTCASCRVEIIVPLERKRGQKPQQQWIKLFFSAQRLDRIEESVQPVNTP